MILGIKQRAERAVQAGASLSKTDINKKTAAYQVATAAVDGMDVNAVEDAVGVRIHELPITAEKVYHALRNAAGVRIFESRRSSSTMATMRMPDR